MPEFDEEGNQMISPRQQREEVTNALTQESIRKTEEMMSIMQQSHDELRQAFMAMLTVMQQQTAVLNRPKVATLSDGRQIRVE